MINLEDIITPDEILVELIPERSLRPDLDEDAPTVAVSEMDAIETTLSIMQGQIDELQARLLEAEDNAVNPPDQAVATVVPNPHPIGAPTLYMVDLYRERDEDMNLIAIGSETGTTRANIDDNHSLSKGPDWVRFHD